MYEHLTREQRYAIYLGLQEGKSLKAIVRQINLHSSTVSREIRRNSTRRGHLLRIYSADLQIITNNNRYDH